jgi:hypothetical protein
MAGFGGRIFRRSLRESVIACEFAHVLSNRARNVVPTYRAQTPLFSVQRADPSALAHMAYKSRKKEFTLFCLDLSPIFLRAAS